MAIAQLEGKTALFCIILLMAMDYSTFNLHYAMGLYNQEAYAKLWHDQLTLRLFFISLYNGIRDGFGPKLNLDEMVKEATVAARADMKIAQDDMPGAMLGWPGKTWIAIWTFCWQWFRYLVFYGLAVLIGLILRGLS